LKGILNEQGKDLSELNITPENFADLIVLIREGKVTSRLAKNILKEMFLTGLDPRKIIEDKNLEQISDEETLGKIVEKIAKDNLPATEDYRKGKTNALQFLIGKAMAELKGQANPDILKKLFEDYLSK